MEDIGQDVQAILHVIRFTGALVSACLVGGDEMGARNYWLDRGSDPAAKCAIRLPDRGEQLLHTNNGQKYGVVFNRSGWTI